MNLDQLLFFVVYRNRSDGVSVGWGKLDPVKQAVGGSSHGYGRKLFAFKKFFRAIKEADAEPLKTIISVAVIKMSGRECAGCRDKLNDIPNLRCSRCKAKYHHSCLNMSIKDYNALTSEYKQGWVCVMCRSNERRGGDNSNTPVRSVSSPQNVTQRTKERAAAAAVTFGATALTAALAPSADDCTSIQPSTLRDIIREELQSAFKLQILPQLAEIRDVVSSFEASMTYYSDELQKIQSVQAVQSAALESMQLENNTLRDTCHSLSLRLAQLDQQSRSTNVEIQCVPEHKQENLVNTIQQLGKTIKCPISDGNIHYCSRLAKMNSTSPRPRSILVKFSSPRLRDEFLAATSKFNKYNKDDKLNTSHLGIGTDKKSAVYVVEHLTAENKALHAAARSKAKELKYKFVWVRDGRIFMRKNEESSFLHVKHMDMLRNLS